MAADEVANAMSRLRDAEVRCIAMEEALHRSEARADAAMAGKSMIEAELTLVRSQQADIHGESKASVQRMEGDRAALVQRLEAEQAANAALRERVDTLNTELRHHTEHYAQQIKDAVTEAERRVKPMLVELDALRGMATSYQASVRDANQKEFEYMQQLSTAKARADRLDLQVREQSDRLDALMLERDALVRHSGTNETVGRLIVAMVEAGRLSEAEIAALGTNIDSFVNIPARCPACETGEPELVQHENEFDLSCPDCDRSSGAAASRLCAVSRFRDVAGPDSMGHAKR
jgi:chromosome segregation ATPase